MLRHLSRPSDDRAAAALFAALLVGVLAACGPSFRLNQYPTNEALYTAALAQYEDRNWDNAVSALERLTLQLPPRDTLLPRSHYYLGLAHKGRGEELLAAQSFVRLVESFPTDTLADDALLEAADAYRRLWRKPALDAQYGELAAETYRTFLSAYGDASPLAAQAREGLAQVREWLARKDFDTGREYQRRRAYDSAIIYYQDVVEIYPETEAARQSLFRLHEIYGELRYREEAAEVCNQLRAKYPDRGDVRDLCGAAPAPATPPPAAPPPDSGAVAPLDGSAPPAAIVAERYPPRAPPAR